MAEITESDEAFLRRMEYNGANGFQDMDRLLALARRGAALAVQPERSEARIWNEAIERAAEVAESAPKMPGMRGRLHVDGQFYYGSDSFATAIRPLKKQETTNG